MKTISIRLLLVLLLVSVARGDEIKVLLNPESTNVSDTLIVLFPPKVSVFKGQSTLKYRIINRSSRDIFVVIKSSNVEGWKYLERPGHVMRGGARCYGTTDTGALESLRLLNVPRRSKDGELLEGKDKLLAETDAEVIVDAGGDNRDLSDWVGSSGMLDIQISFYVSDSKDRRSARLAVPVEIQAAEQPGPAQPATQPADKPPVKDQPSTPTSKVSPR
jgi:hypothetical protein